MTFGRRLLWSLSALTAVIACTTADPPLVEFPTLSDGALTEQLRGADEWAVFLDGAKTGTDARILANQRLWYSARDQALWRYSTGWDTAYWMASFAWAKRSVERPELDALVQRLVATGFARVPASRDPQSPFRFGVEIVLRNQRQRWSWPVQGGRHPSGALTPLHRFFEDFGAAASAPGSHWAFQADGALYLAIDCQSIESDGGLEVTLENHGKQAVSLRPFGGEGGAVVVSSPYPVRALGRSLQPIHLEPRGRVSLPFQLDLQHARGTTGESTLWLLVRDPVPALAALPGARQLAATACPMPRVVERNGQPALDTPPRIEASDQRLRQELTQSERAALDAAYPLATLLDSCRGSFSGQSVSERILVLATGASAPGGQDQPRVERVGVVHDGESVAVRSLEQTDSRRGWQYAFNGKRFAGVFRCRVKPGKDREVLDPGARARIHPAAEGIPGDAVCFSTSDVYNNWDCFLYHPAKRQFLLWFEQAFAD